MDPTSNATSSADLQFDFDETISILAKQQFYFGQDRIYGRIKQLSVKIKGAGLVVHRLITTLQKHSPLLYQFKFDEYLHRIVEEIEFLDFDYVYGQFTQKSSILENTPEQLPILITFLVSDILSALRVPAFDKVKSQIKEKALSKFSSLGEMEGSFDKLCSFNNQHLSLLENLSFLDILSRAFHFQRIVRVVAIQITKHINFAVEDLVACNK